MNEIDTDELKDSNSSQQEISKFQKDFYKSEINPISDIGIPLEISDRLNKIQVSTNAKPVIFKEPIDQPGFLSTLAHSFTEENEIAALYNLAGNEIFSKSPYDDQTPEGWTSTDNLNFYKNSDEKYWGRLLESKSPKQQELEFNYIQAQQTENEYYSQGSGIANLIGGIAGAIAGPSSLIPIAALSKYAKTGESVIRNALKVAPGISLASLTHEAAIEADKAGGNLSDLAFNTARDSIAGMTLMGAGAGLGAHFRGQGLYNARKLVNAVNEDVKINFNVNSEGEFIGYEASAMDGSNVSSVIVNKYQEMLDSSLASDGAFAFASITKLTGSLSRVVEGLTSPFLAVRDFTNKIADHSFNTLGIKQGKARKVTADELILDIKSRSKVLSMELNGLWLESNGINQSNQVSDKFKSFQQSMNKEGYISRDDFNLKVHGSVINEAETNNKSINSAAEILRKHVDETYEMFRKSHGLNKEVFSPRTARAYLMRNYDISAVEQNPTKWVQVISDHLAEQDNKITILKRPIKDAEKELKELIIINESSLTADKKLLEKIEVKNKQVKDLKKELDNELRDNPDHSILLDKRNILSSSEADHLNSLMNPINKLKTSTSIISDEVKNIKEKISKSSQAIKRRNITSATKEKHIINKQKLKSELDSKEQALYDAKLIERKELEKLQDMAINGDIPENYFSKDPKTGFIDFTDVKADKPKLRKVYESSLDREEAAESWRSTITNNTSEQVNQAILSKLVPHISENPLSTRALMIPDNVLLDNKFLSSNLDKSVAVYDLTLGKRTVLKSVFKDIDFSKGIDGVIENLVEERDRRERIIIRSSKKLEGRVLELETKLRHPDIKKRNDLEKELKQAKKDIEIDNSKFLDSKTTESIQAKKDLVKLKKEFDRAKKYVSVAFDSLMGRSNKSIETRRFTRSVKNMTISTMLGGVPLTQVTDAAAITLINGVWPTIRDAAIPALKNIGFLLKTKQSKDIRESAAHLHLALEHVNGGHMDKFNNPSSIDNIPISGRIEDALEKLAHVSGNFSGTTYIDNGLQMVTANVSQSVIMQSMFEFKAGILSQKKIDKLLRGGIDPKIWADKFIENYKIAGGEKSELGGYSSKWYDWADDEVKNVMGRALKRSVRETILKKGILDSPFMTNNEVTNLLLLFKGWGFSAFNRYTAPLLQRADRETILPIMFMLGAGALVDPLRKISRGEPADFHSDGWAINAIENSGVLGYLTDGVETANALSGGVFLKKLKNDRFAGRTLGGLAFGPSFGLTESYLKTLQNFVSGKINEVDTKRAIRSIPLTQAWWLRGMTNKLTEGLDLPKSSSQADSIWGFD